MISVDPGIIDTNILIYGLDVEAPQHAASRTLLDAARSSETSLFVTSQILCEFYSVVTNPRRVASARSPAEALAAIAAFLALPGIHVLPIPAAAVPIWTELARQRAVTGGDIFDLQLVATMRANRVERIYTFNGDDFEGFPGLTVMSPQL